MPLLLAGAAGAHTTFVCAHDDVARESCCCPGAHAGYPAPALKAPCCCEVKLVKAASAEPRVRVDGSGHPYTAIPMATGSFAVVAAPPVAIRIIVPDHLPPIGPPLTLLKHSFLI